MYLPNKNISKSIIVHTSKGKEIPNSQFFEISRTEIQVFAELESRYRMVQYRCGPNPTYNCHGLTFASRRTGIYENAAIQQIIKEDDYKELNVDEVLPGDIIVYYDDKGDALHSGVVLTKAEGVLKIPTILSKWGKYKEAIHHANNCPYQFNVKYYRIK